MFRKIRNLRLLTGTQWLLFIVSTLMWIGVKLGQFMMRTQGQWLSTDAKWIASAVGISGLVGFLLRFPLGLFADHIKYKVWLIRGSLAVSVIGAFIYILHPSIYTLYAYNLCMGTTICSYVMFNVLFSEVSRRSGIIIDIAILAISNNIGSWVGPILGGLLIPYQRIEGVLRYDFSGLITAKVSLALLIAALLFSLWMKDIFSSEKPVFKNIINVYLIVVSLLGMIVTFMKYATLKYAFETIVRTGGGLPFQVGNIDANYDILHVIGGLAAGYWLSRKFGNRLTIMAGIVLMSLSLSLSYIFAARLTLFLVFNLFAGFGMGMAYITLMSMSIINSANKHSCMGFFQSVYMLGVYYAPRVCELILKQTSLNNVYIVCSLLGICSLLLLFFLKEEKPERS